MDSNLLHLLFAEQTGYLTEGQICKILDLDRENVRVLKQRAAKLGVGIAKRAIGELKEIDR